MDIGWVNKTQKTEEEMYPAPGPKAPLHYKPRQEDSLVLVQGILCVAVIIFALLVRNMDAKLYAGMQQDFNTMLTQGIRFDGKTPIVRFVSDAVDNVRTATSNWVEEMRPKQVGDAQLAAVSRYENVQNTVAPQGKGGFWPAKKSVVPEGATLDDYTLQETLLLPVSGVTTSGFGFRKNPVNGKEDFHMGLDLGANEGAGVAAALAGQVTEAGYNAVRGNYIVIHHRAGLQTLYQHLSYGFVRAGETIKAGQMIAAVGSTGMSTGPHLHFELVIDGKRVNPTKPLELPNV